MKILKAFGVKNAEERIKYVKGNQYSLRGLQSSSHNVLTVILQGLKFGMITFYKKFIPYVHPNEDLRSIIN